MDTIQNISLNPAPAAEMPFLFVEGSPNPSSATRSVQICGRATEIENGEDATRLALRVLGKVVCDENGRVTRLTVDFDFVMSFIEAVRFNQKQGRPLRTYGMSQLRDIKTYIAASLDAQREKPVLRGVGGCKPKSALGSKVSPAWA